MTQKNLFEEEIVRRFFSIERSHIDCVTFFERFGSRMKKQIRDLSLRRREAKDFYNDVVEHLLNVRPEQYNEEGNFEAWLFMVVHNLYLSKLRKEHWRIDLLEYKFRLNDYSYYKRERLINLVREKMNELTEIQRRTILMVFFEELSQKEICKREGIGLNTHNKRLSRAKKNLVFCWYRQESLRFSQIKRSVHA